MNRRFWDRLRQIAPERERIGRTPGALRMLRGVYPLPRIDQHPDRSSLAVSTGKRAPFPVLRGLRHRPCDRLPPRVSDGIPQLAGNDAVEQPQGLPLGPIELVFEDGLVLAPLLLLSVALPEPRAMSLLCAFLLCHLGAIVVSLWLTRVRTIGYLSAFGLGFAVKLWHQPIECAAMAALVYLIAYEGLIQGLDRFPWTPRRFSALHTDITSLSPREPCGWPHDRMLGEVSSADGIPRFDAVICCALGSWWLYVLASFIPDEKNRIGLICAVCSFPFILFPVIRIAIYTQGHRSPISLWGRILTLRWIIPGYDKVFLGPLARVCLRPGELRPGPCLRLAG